MRSQEFGKLWFRLGVAPLLHQRLTAKEDGFRSARMR